MANELKNPGLFIDVFPSISNTAPLVLLNAVDKEGGLIKKEIGDKASLAIISDLVWNDDLSPWPCDAVFRGGMPFGGKAAIYAERLSCKILPAIIENYALHPEYIAIAGYSLAGLFALYTAYCTCIFSRIASVSGSLWYPGFSEFARSHSMKKRPERIYFSLGDKEVRTSNRYMKRVEAETRRLSDFYSASGISTKTEFNPGNHFQNHIERTVKGIQWILE